MSISVLVKGALFSAPETRTSTKGKTYARARMTVRDGEAKTWGTMTAFDQAADHILQLQEGDALTVAGRARLRPYTDKAGEAGASLDVVVERLIAVKPWRAAKGEGEEDAHPDDDIDGDIAF